MHLTLTIPKAAELIGISRTSAYEAARRGELPTIKMGRRLLVPRKDLEEMLGTLPDEQQNHSMTGNVGANSKRTAVGPSRFRLTSKEKRITDE